MPAASLQPEGGIWVAREYQQQRTSEGVTSKPTPELQGAHHTGVKRRSFPGRSRKFKILRRAHPRHLRAAEKEGDDSRVSCSPHFFQCRYYIRGGGGGGGGMENGRWLGRCSWAGSWERPRALSEVPSSRVGVGKFGKRKSVLKSKNGNML